METRGILCWLSIVLTVLTVLHAAAAETQAPLSGYRIGPNDVIRIQVFGEDDLTVEGRVGGDGKLDYPLLGVLQVGGKTTHDLQAILTKRLAAGYVRSPKVTVSIVRHRNVYVSGEVKAPGGFPFEDGLTAQKAVTMAGGFTDKAVRNTLAITRRTEGHEQTFNAPLTASLLPDDVIVVAQLQKFYLMGEVMRPGPYPFEEQLTAKKAVSFGGGFTDKADKKSLKVTRVTESGAQTIRIGPDDLILPSDILAIGSHNYKVYISGEVKAPGAYPYSDNISLQKALTLAGGVTEKADRKELTVRRVVDGQEQSLVLPLEAAVQPEDLIVVREGQKVYVTGEVKTPGRYAYEPGATIQRVLTVAGGVTEKAEAGVVKLTRMTKQGVETTVAPQDAVVLPDDIVLVSPKSDQFYISGEVKTPGSYAHKDGLSLQKALAMAGGATEKADRQALTVRRVVEGQEQSLVLSLEAAVQPEDLIIVREGQRVYVTGEVKTPGRYAYEPGATIQRVLTVAGGVTEKAEAGVVKLTRTTEQGVETTVVPQDAVVLPEDIILVVPKSDKFYVSGEVKNPGSYTHKEGLSLQKALAMAGGVTERGDVERLQLVRIVNNQEEHPVVTLESPIMPEDTIVVAERQKVYVTGEVRTPGRYTYEAGISVQKAISMAGGFTEKADKTDVRVERRGAQGVTTLQVDPNAPVQPDDLLVIPQARRFYVNGEVKKPGDFWYERGLTLHMAITMAGGFTDKASKTPKVLRKVNGQERTVELALDAPILPDDIIVVSQRFF